MLIVDGSSVVCSSDLCAEFLLTVFISLFMLVLLRRLGAMLAFLLGGGIAAVLLAGAWFAFIGAGMLLSVVYPLGASLLVYGLLVFHNYFHEERERRFVRGAFGQYLAQIGRAHV